MAQLDIRVIQTTFEEAKPIADKVADKFYEILFTDYPESQGLFWKTDMAAQKKALMSSLSYVIDNLSDESKVLNHLRALGKRHLKYGVKEEHYPWVRESFLKTLEFFFERAWTSPLAEQWTILLNTAAEIMLSAMESSESEESSASSSVTIDLDAKLQALAKARVVDLIEEKLKVFVKREIDGLSDEDLERYMDQIIKKAS